mmetsp:Transcript_8167/g.11777  ORF Transcript_8167/g.11777 Transcript_8167/m.11777 type:complete len:382 (+) Transcript_8167:45-1190(+)
MTSSFLANRFIFVLFIFVGSLRNHYHVSAFSFHHQVVAFHHNRRSSNNVKQPTLRKMTTSSSPVEDTDDNTDGVPEQLGQQQQKVKITPALWELAVVGGMATMVGDLAVHPVDCIKTLQQSNIGMGLNLLQATQKLWQNYGIAGFYAGINVIIPSDVIGGCIKFSVYEMLKKWSDEHISNPTLALFVCAAVAFVAASVVLVPGELIKQTLQVGHYDSIAAAVMGIFSNEGILGFFRGYGGVLFRDIPYTMLELGLYDNFKRMVQRRLPKEDQSLKPWQEVILAAIVGAISGLSTAPMDNIKTKVMIDGYSNFWNCFVETVQQHGVASVFAGAGARAAWLVPFTAIYLPIYDMLKRKVVAIRSAKDDPDDEVGRVEELLERL